MTSAIMQLHYIADCWFIELNFVFLSDGSGPLTDTLSVAERHLKLKNSGSYYSNLNITHTGKG